MLGCRRGLLVGCGWAGESLAEELGGRDKAEAVEQFSLPRGQASGLNFSTVRFVVDQQAIAREGPQESASGGLLLLPSRVWGQALTVDACSRKYSVNAISIKNTRASTRFGEWRNTGCTARGP